MMLTVKAICLTTAPVPRLLSMLCTKRVLSRTRRTPATKLCCTPCSTPTNYTYMTTRYNSQPGHITLMNGPGEGNRFHVQRAPILLRVVSDLNNGWDVLDQLEDTPLP